MPELLKIVIPPLNIKSFKLELIGTKELIVHKWSEKAMKEMAAKQAGEIVIKCPRDPQEEYESSIYRDEEGKCCFPSVAFKAGAVRACKRIKSMKMIDVRGFFHIDEEFVPIRGNPRFRTDMVRIGMGTADLRYRGGFRDWATSFSIKYDADAITATQIVGLFNIAGFHVGVGEWRAEKSAAAYGRYTIKEA